MTALLHLFLDGQLAAWLLLIAEAPHREVAAIMSQPAPEAAPDRAARSTTRQRQEMLPQPLTPPHSYWPSVADRLLHLSSLSSRFYRWPIACCMPCISMSSGWVQTVSRRLQQRGVCCSAGGRRLIRVPPAWAWPVLGLWLRRSRYGGVVSRATRVPLQGLELSDPCRRGLRS